MKTPTKLTTRLFKKHFARLITIIAIVIVSVGFMSGILEVKNKILISVDDQYAQYNMHDLYVKSDKTFGFSSQERDLLIQEFGNENIEWSFCYEDKIDNEIIRIYNFDLLQNKINKLDLIEGQWPSNDNEILVERKTDTFKSNKVGDKVSVMGKDYTVCGILYNPLMTIILDEPSFRYEDQFLTRVYYVHGTPLMINDAYITLTDREVFDSFSTDYKEVVEGYKLDVENTLGEDNVSVLTLYENKGIYSLYSYAMKVGDIGIIFVVFFMLVTVLVVYSSMKRLFDEERTGIACQKTLGFHEGNIVKRYVFFVFIATVIGGFVAFPVGYGLTSILYTAFNLQYKMMPLPLTLNFKYYALTFLIIIISAVVTTLISGFVSVKDKPITLLQPKAPKIGKKTFLEHIPFVWNKLSFKYKSTLRNVFLFKSRFFMTVISVLGSAVLLFAGFGLMDNAFKIKGADMLITISLALVAFSAVLCALVIYNITNINVSERTREIATLMVLGYQGREVAGYIFREIYIMCMISALLGLPVGALFINYAFNFIDFGSLANVNWWTYVLTPMITMLFGFMSTRLLRKKITSIDMNASLKSLE